MGLVAKIKEFRSSRQKSKFDKAAQLAKTVKAIKEDRWAALEYLGGVADPKASVQALLPRFEFSLEHGINDTKEKELVMKSSVGRGKDALPYVKEWIQSTAKIAWPIKILKEIGSESEIVDALVGALNFKEVSFDQASVDKNYDVLCYLRDCPINPLQLGLQHFLTDPDERVRFACVEVFIEQGDHQGVASLLEPYLGDNSAENTRIRQSVVRAFVERGWRVSNPEKLVLERELHGIRVENDGRVVSLR